MNMLPIIKLTIKSAMRSHIFQILLVFLTVLTITLPNILKGDGTVLGFIQISLEYNLYAIMFILTLSTIWLTSFIMTRDMEEYQLHMLVTKPLSRINIWLGKCIGVFSINLVLLCVSLLITYFMVLWKFNNTEYIGTKEDIKAEKIKIEKEVLVSRKVFYPAFKNTKQQALEAFKKDAKNKEMSIDEKEDLIEKYRQDFLAKSAVVNHKDKKTWVFEGLPSKYDGILKLRYKFFVKRVDLQDISNQRETQGILGINVETESKGQTVTNWNTKNVTKIRGAVSHEESLNSAIIKKDNTVEVSFTNLDQKGEPLFFIPKHGPKLLIEVGGFWDNYIRGGIVLTIQLLVLTIVCSTMASFLSMPSAIFTSSVYLFTSYFIPSLISDSRLPIDSVHSIFSWLFEQLMICVTIPITYFDVSSLLANGEIIEFSFIGSIFLKVVVLRALPIMFIGIYIYNKRELGLVIRK